MYNTIHISIIILFLFCIVNCKLCGLNGDDLTIPPTRTPTILYKHILLAYETHYMLNPGTR
jgi:hypothetical protein